MHAANLLMHAANLLMHAANLLMHAANLLMHAANLALKATPRIRLPMTLARRAPTTKVCTYYQIQIYVYNSQSRHHLPPDARLQIPQTTLGCPADNPQQVERFR
jgi:hypothetical protein